MYIYIITHPKFKDWIKIGRAVSVEKRLRGYQVCCPNREFKIEYKIKTPFIYNIENYFDNFVKGNGHEWYQCTTEFAINKITEILKEIEINPKYLEQKNNKAGISFVLKKNHNIIKFDYLVDDKKFITIRELSIYIDYNYDKLCVIMKDVKLEIEINGFKIMKQRHFNE